MELSRADQSRLEKDKENSEVERRAKWLALTSLPFIFRRSLCLNALFLQLQLFREGSCEGCSKGTAPNLNGFASSQVQHLHNLHHPRHYLHRHHQHQHQHQHHHHHDHDHNNHDIIIIIMIIMIIVIILLVTTTFTTITNIYPLHALHDLHYLHSQCQTSLP